MAQAMAFAHPNKGTLIPGQMITVNKYTVQVDRYLSQGGFAHVYLVRTATPVYNTMYHVLKRIAVPDDKMLTEVKQEVDVMRLLKGHPNIVHLIDAASHKLPDGTYEVFILMEFCPGGGIIDMMNRRLRERLTEAEILTIFADVCEGVAHMHNARPALLHRDLKVENILQSSPTSYKLCDFGSAARPSKVPNNAEEIRALETDLNRHTTLQYRAPEMVDLYLRRPVDEKSDVWALGVLLYKLCYYTTPFEEHGPLAILNVLYKIPPYPVYSPQMNALIGSMLREHGVHRPTIFELLETVHRMRGTKSQFHYNIPTHPISSKIQPSQRPSVSPNPLDTTISYRAAPQVAKLNFNHAPSTSPSKNAGVQARDKVLEAVAPMRRGRPSRPQDADTNAGEQWLNDGFGEQENDAWKSAVKVTSTKTPNKDDAWSVPSNPTKSATTGFGDDFSKPWDAKRSNDVSSTTAPQITMKSTTTPRTPNSSASTTLGYSSTKGVSKKDRDAFDGLGFASDNKPAPTLGEARKLRTGLATMTTPLYNSGVGGSSVGQKSYPQSARPSPSPQPGLQPPQQQTLNPHSSGSSWTALRPPSRPVSSQRAEGVTPESRFPSLEEIDAQFGGSPTPKSDNRKVAGPASRRDPPTSRFNDVPGRDSTTNGSSGGVARRVSSRLTSPPSASLGQDGVRSQQVTGFAMRESRKDADYKVYESKKNKEKLNGTAPLERVDSNFRRPSPVRKHRTATALRSPETAPSTTPSRQPPFSTSSNKTPHLPPRPTPAQTNKDWLTGDDDDEQVASQYTTAPESVDPPQPILRQSPSKRASFIEKSSVPIAEAAVIEHDHTSTFPPPSPVSKTPSEAPSIISRANKIFPALEISTDRDAPPVRTPGLTDNWSPVAAKHEAKEPESVSSADEGPEDVDRFIPKVKRPAERKTRKGRQSSVHDLVDLWGGGATSGRERETETEESNRSTTTPLPSKVSKTQRRTTLMVSPTREDSSIDRTIVSPTLHPSRVQSHHSRPTTGQHERQSSSSTAVSPSPVSSRGRPQSMFVFPSSEYSTPLPAPSPGLSTPDEPKPRTVRRTSINDMVQKFEAIDASVRVIGAKPTPLRTAENSRLPSKAEPPSGKLNLPVPEEALLPRRTSPSSTRRASPRPVSPPPGQQEDNTPKAQRSRVRASSMKPTPTHTPVPRKGAVDLSQSQGSGDTRSPSPEKPFQGVGRLIDQWQRKAADSDTVMSPAPKRGGMVAKRAGLVSGGAGRS